MASFSLTYLLITCINSDTSVPVGQNPSIVYPANSKPEDAFLIYNSAQGLESLYCTEPNCADSTKQILKCDAKLYSSAIFAIDYTLPAYSSCYKQVTNSEGKTETLPCTYYIVIGYGSLTSKQNTNSISFLICYDVECSAMDEVLIETSFNSAQIFGHSISLTTYLILSSGERYPMFTYSKYSTLLKQFILNVIICADFYCNTWVGKTHSYDVSNPPFSVLGIKPSGDSSCGKGVVSIQETWSSETNFVTIMFARNVNITRNKTIVSKNVWILVVSTCGLSSSTLVHGCDTFVGKELNSTLIYGVYGEVNGLKTNQLSTVYYSPSAQGQPGLPLFITAYIVSSSTKTNTNQLWLLYCFNIFCDSPNQTHYQVRQSKYIDYPRIIISYQTYLPTVIFFENSTDLMLMTCNNGAVTWNCTDKDYNHPTVSILQNSAFQTSSMQISVESSPYLSAQNLILFSQVMGIEGGGMFNGSVLINCQSLQCKLKYGPIYLYAGDENTEFSTSFDITVFVVCSWIVSFVTIFGIFSIYRFISPDPFISANIRNAYLTKVALDQTRIRPLSYWFFFSNLICSAMCIIPWFAYFDMNNSNNYLLMIIPPFLPVILTLVQLLIFSFPLMIECTTFIKYFNLYLSIAYYLSMLMLSYSFSYVWNLRSDNCQTSDLSGLKIVILVGHVATFCVVQYLLFWNIKCFQAIRLASPQNLNEPIHHSHQNINNSAQKRIPNQRLLAALDDS